MEVISACEETRLEVAERTDDEAAYADFRFLGAVSQVQRFLKAWVVRVGPQTDSPSCKADLLDGHFLKAAPLALDMHILPVFQFPTEAVPRYADCVFSVPDFAIDRI